LMYVAECVRAGLGVLQLLAMLLRAGPDALPAVAEVVGFGFEVVGGK
jgi:hypothetical protein